MWETTFQHASSTPIPPNVSIETGIELLHDFDFVVRLSPDCRGCRPIEPKTAAKPNGNAPNGTSQEVKYYEVEDDLPFIPKRLWSGGVKYQADFVPTPDGCDITVHAPGGFTSTNHWRLIRENTADHSEPALDRMLSKDALHADQDGSGWYVQIVSDAKCNKTFAGFVKGFLKNSHQQLENAFIENLKIKARPKQVRRPTLGRRRSSVL